MLVSNSNKLKSASFQQITFHTVGSLICGGRLKFVSTGEYNCVLCEVL